MTTQKQRRHSETASPMRLFLSVVVAVSVATNSLFRPVLAFSGAWSDANACSRSTLLSATNDDVASARDEETKSLGDTRRSVLKKASLVAGPLGVSFMAAGESQAAVGTLPEFAETNAILQGVTIDVADQSQQESMIGFLTDAFDFQVLRQRKVGSTTDTWLGFGPEQLSIPAGFTLPVSSFNAYGGHASIRIRYDTQSSSVLYRTGDAAPGDNIAYLQLGVPTYRVSQMTKNGANILDAYGYINVVSPSGLPVRGIVGLRPDPIMFLAINCASVDESRAFYQKLGFVEQEYPFARPSRGTGPFEPGKPAKSVYLAPSPNCMGVLLLPSKNKKKVTPNPVFESLNLVYTPSEGSDTSEEMVVADPSGVSIAFQPVERFEAEEKATRIARRSGQ